MRFCGVIMLFAFLGCNPPAPVESVDVPVQDPIVQSRRIAIDDFNAGVLVLPRDSFSCNGYYVEEIFFRWYGIKAEVIVQSPARDTSSEEMKQWQRCYDKIQDSLIVDRYGKDIYRRLSSAGDSLEKQDPARYPAADQSIILPPRFALDSLKVVTIWKDEAYPFAKGEDSVLARTIVGVKYDSTGKTSIGWISNEARGVRDLTRTEVIKQLPSVEPVFRWGQYQSGEIEVRVVYLWKKKRRLMNTDL